MILCVVCVFFFKQKTAYEMRISDWSSDVCSSDLRVIRTAQARGKPVAVCGEMASDAAFVPLLLALGLEELSMHPSTLLEVRRAIRDCDLGSLRARLPALLRARDRPAIEAWIQKVAAPADNGGLTASTPCRPTGPRRPQPPRPNPHTGKATTQ